MKQLTQLQQSADWALSFALGANEEYTAYGLRCCEFATPRSQPVYGTIRASKRRPDAAQPSFAKDQARQLSTPHTAEVKFTRYSILNCKGLCQVAKISHI